MFAYYVSLNIAQNSINFYLLYHAADLYGACCSLIPPDLFHGKYYLIMLNGIYIICILNPITGLYSFSY